MTDDQQEPGKVSDEQMRRLATMVLELAWGDTFAVIKDNLALFAYLLELTHDDEAKWDEQFGGEYINEFEVTPDDARMHPSEWRLAHLSRLVRNLAWDYGIKTDSAGRADFTGQLTPYLPAGILAELKAIVELVPPPTEPE